MDNLKINMMGYIYSEHFLERKEERQIEEKIILLCLEKGKRKREPTGKHKFILTQDIVVRAIKQGNIKDEDWLGFDTLTIITEKDLLITLFTRYSDY